MNAQDYIEAELDRLKQPINLTAPASQDEMIQEVTRLVLSKKFRKYSVAPEPLEHIKTSIEWSVKNNEPIKFNLPFGAYKLWRLKETPEVDWAELFTFMYFTRWLKPICEIYKPGVWFDFYSDDVIIPRMNNIPTEDLVTYKDSFEKLLAFMKAYQPDNLKMTLSRVIDQYDNQEDFEEDYQEQLKNLTASLEGGLPELSPEEAAMVELNVKASDEQLADPKWREKVMMIHNSYATVKGRRPYYRPIEQHKIMVVVTPLWGMLCVGSTKDSTVKYWVGTGVLKPRDDSFRQIVLSPKQLESAKFVEESVAFDGVDGKNFSKIRVIK